MAQSEALSGSALDLTDGQDPERGTLCGGCKLSVESETGGIVVAFGQALWHVDCFKCAKCGNRVNADTNLLLLSDGSPVCSSCSYNCSICKQPILDEAIMTGDESYHAACFACRSCSRRIEELVFAKTSQGIYCMACHNERVARSRRHAEAKKRKQAKLKQQEEQKREKSTDPTSSVLPSGVEGQGSPPASATSPGFDTPAVTPNIDAGYRQTAKRISTTSLQQPSQRSIPPLVKGKSSATTGSSVNTAGNPSATTSQPDPTRGSARPSSHGKVDALTLTSTPEADDLRRKNSFDTSSRPNSNYLDGETEELSSGLAISSSKADRGRSVTPGVPTKSEKGVTNSAAAPTLPPKEHPPAPERTEVSVPQNQAVTAPAIGLPPIHLSLSDPAFSDWLALTSEAGDGEYSQPATNGASTFAAAGGDTAAIGYASNGFGINSIPLPSTNGHVENLNEVPGPRSSMDSRGSPGTSLMDHGNASTGTLPQVITPRERVDSATSVASSAGRPGLSRTDTGDLLTRRLKEALSDAAARGSAAIKLDKEFVDAILGALQSTQTRNTELKGKLDNVKRVSQRMYDGLAVAQDEYDHELASRRDAETEISRLRLQLSTQTATINVMMAEQRKREMLNNMSKDLNQSMQELEKNISKIKAERDILLAEIDELQATKNTGEAEGASLSRSLTSRFDGIKSQYRRELEPLVEQKEILVREIAELKQAKDLSLEETTSWTARNDELLELNVAMQRQYDTLQAALKPRPPEKKSKTAFPTLASNPPSASHSLYSVNASTTSGTLIEEREDIRFARSMKSDTDLNPAGALRKFPWFKGKESTPLPPVPKASPAPVAPAPIEKPKPLPPPQQSHNFKQESVLRFARCDHCGDKMWGTQFRCINCSFAVHARCLNLVQMPCRETQTRDEKDIVDIQPIPPSMFGRDLIEQTRADAKDLDRMVPVIVEKCIMAVEALAMDYEGIYRKTGGASQSKAITQLFERGNYDSFDLCDSDQFNDICSVTSVLKTYFRSLPNPLLTFDLHEEFVQAANYRDPSAKSNALTDLVDQLPSEHYETLRYLMMHLHRVMLQSDINLMNARNLGVVFGPTLMRSADSTKEFADMAGKALAIEWLVENAPEVFEATDS